MNTVQLRKELKRIGDRNRRFDKMTPSNRRVTIAKDTIAALIAKKIVAYQGDGYLSDRHTENGDKLPDDYKCNVCALGGMFIGLTTRIKGLSVKTESGLRSQVIEPLVEYFDVYQLAAIEYAFERGAVALHGLNPDEAFRCEDFGMEYEDHNDRLIAIMQNIIDNKGTFKP